MARYDVVQRGIDPIDGAVYMFPMQRISHEDMGPVVNL